MLNLNFALVCDSFIPGERSKYSLIEIFDKLIAKNELPASRLRTAVVVGTSGRAGTYTEHIQIVNQETEEVIMEATGEVTIDKDGSRNVFVANFLGLSFPNYGKYWIKVTIDGQEEPLTDPNKHYVEVSED